MGQGSSCGLTWRSPAALRGFIAQRPVERKVMRLGARNKNDVTHNAPPRAARSRSVTPHSLLRLAKQSVSGQPGAVSIRWSIDQARPKQLSGPNRRTNARASSLDTGLDTDSRRASTCFRCSTEASDSEGNGPSSARRVISGRIAHSSAMMWLPNCEQETSVEPSIRRAKS